MVMIGLYAKRYCCLAIDCRVIYKKRFFGQDVCFFHHLLINVFFRFGLVHFKRQKNILKKVIYTESPITEHLLTGIIPMYPVGITKQVNHIMFA